MTTTSTLVVNKIEDLEAGYVPFESQFDDPDDARGANETRTVFEHYIEGDLADRVRQRFQREVDASDPFAADLSDELVFIRENATDVWYSEFTWYGMGSDFVVSCGGLTQDFHTDIDERVNALVRFLEWLGEEFEWDERMTMYNYGY